jgi:hypothetical protein
LRIETLQQLGELVGQGCLLIHPTPSGLGQKLQAAGLGIVRLPGMKTIGTMTDQLQQQRSIRRITFGSTAEVGLTVLGQRLGIDGI